MGLTGGLASGKSTVAGLLRELGAFVFDADAIVRELYAPGGAGEAAARELFGESALDPRGGIHRARIAAIVFSEPEKRHALEARVHPLVRAEIARRFEAARAAGAAVAVAEASQTFEAGSEGAYDRTLLVVAPESERIRRWEEKGGDAEDARRRIAAQITPEAAARRATDLVVNDGSLSDLTARVGEIYRGWLETGRDSIR